MNKFTYALALGAGLVLSLAAPNAQADPDRPDADPGRHVGGTVQQPVHADARPVLTSELRFHEHAATRASWSRRSSRGQVRRRACMPMRTSSASTTSTTPSTNQPTSVNSASMLFNATPVVTNFTGTGTTAAYVVTDGQVGGINMPQAAPGSVVQTPSSIAWLPGIDDRIVDLPVPESDHEHGTARGRGRPAARSS